MKSFQHIILTAMIVWLLVACRGRSNTDRTELSVSGNELIETSAPFQNEMDIDGMFMQENYICTNNDTTANILNIVNMFQFRELIHHQEVMDDLAVNNYALLPDSLLQLFQVYQRNDSLQIPNFVTVDLMAQLSHIYESYLLRTVEEKHFSPMLAELCLALYHASVEQANRAAKEDIKNMAIYNAAFFAVPYSLLTGKTLKTQGDYPAIVEIELAYIAQQESRRPALLNLRSNFDYSLFKPYGHYTRTADLRRYFKAWKWLQLAPYCSDNSMQLQQAVLVALTLQTAATQSGISAMDVYSRLTEAMKWFTGQFACTSLLDVALLLKKERVTTVTAALDAKLLAKVNAMVLQMQPNAGKVPVVNYPAVCRNGIYFVPQPAYVEEGSDVSSYNKRLESVREMQQKAGNSPVFVRKQAWNRKIIETSSALRVKMKHNVLLYGVVPDHPEPLTIASPVDTLPQPLIMGYVEPALSFWTKLREWVALTEKNYRLITDTLPVFSERMYRYAEIMEDVARRELNNERLSDETYRFIAHIGDSIRQFTLSMIEPEIDRWDWTAGTDRSVAVFERVHQRYAAENSSNDILYAATGNVNQIYVIVEIDGNLYLTKGATFSCHEFSMPHEKELKDQDWQEMRRLK